MNQQLLSQMKSALIVLSIRELMHQEIGKMQQQIANYEKEAEKLKAIAAKKAKKTNKGYKIAGWICLIIGSILLAITLIGVVLAIISIGGLAALGALLAILFNSGAVSTIYGSRGVMFLVALTHPPISGSIVFLPIVFIMIAVNLAIIGFPLTVIGLCLLLSCKRIKKSLEADSEKAQKKYQAYVDEVSTPGIQECTETIEKIVNELREMEEEDNRILEFLPASYHDIVAVAYMYHCVENMRADTLKEAINLWERHLIDISNAEILEQQRRELEAALTHMEANQQATNQLLSDIEWNQQKTNDRLRQISWNQIFRD